jgi:hypothetical protein
MCTIGLDHTLNIIFKNRDKNIPTEEEIVVASDYIAVRTKGKDYYSLGFNRFGCGFVSAAINAPMWTHLVKQGKAKEARELFIKENSKFISPMVLVSKMLPEVQTIEEWIKALTDVSSTFCGYNIIVVEPHLAKIIEVFKQNRQVHLLDDKSVATNHFQAIEYGPASYYDYPSSFDRHQYATEMIETAHSIEDIFAMLKPRDLKNRKRIWRDSHFFTVSTSVIDLSRRCLYYAQDLHDDYRKIILSDGEDKEMA